MYIVVWQQIIAGYRYSPALSVPFRLGFLKGREVCVTAGGKGCWLRTRNEEEMLS